MELYWQSRCHLFHLLHRWQLQDVGRNQSNQPTWIQAADLLLVWKTLTFYAYFYAAFKEAKKEKNILKERRHVIFVEDHSGTGEQRLEGDPCHLTLAIYKTNLIFYFYLWRLYQDL
jgi:hypothetical protein